jgi:Peroxisomal biogenesis factor 11 (PEX11)
MMAKRKAGKEFQDTTDYTLQMIGKAALFLYWVFDNIVILSTVKILIVKDQKFYSKLGMFFWWVQLVVTNANTIIKLKQLSVEALEIKKSIKENPSMDNPARDKLKALPKKRKELILTLIKLHGDMLPASQGWGLPELLVGKPISEGACGVGGFISAAISVYSVYNS